MKKRDKTVSINLRLPAHLHRKLVEAGASSSPANSLNSEILSRLFESFDRPGLAKLETQLSKFEADGTARIQALQLRAEQTNQRMEIRLAEVEELKRLVEDKLK